MPARTPIEAKSLRKLLDAFTDKIMDAIKKSAAVTEHRPVGVETTIKGKVEVDGEFGFDAEGEMVFTGNVNADAPLAEGIVNTEAGMELTKSHNVERDGRGTFKLALYMESNVTPDAKRKLLGGRPR